MRFCPFEYIRVVSKELERAISGCNIRRRNTLSVAEITSEDRIFRRNIDGVDEKVVEANSNLQNVDTVNQFVKLCKGSSVVMFSDGSVCNGPVGSGACAAVLYPLLDTEEVMSCAKAVGKKVSSEQCEVEGIILGMEMAISYLSACQSNKGSGRILVFCDCESAIDTVDRKLELVRYPEIFKRLSAIQSQLNEMDKYVNLVHISGHTGIIGNELADVKAREAAHSIAAGKTEASNDITVADVYKLSKDIAMRSWQRKWNEDSVGRFTHSLIPEVGTKVIYPKTREVGVSYCRILLHDTMLNDDACRTGIADTHICECGQENETVEHVLLRCPRYVEARRVMKDEITTTLNILNIQRKKKRKVEINDTLLLTPYSYDNSNNINRKEDICIKEALFEFLSCRSKNLTCDEYTYVFTSVDITLGWISPSIYISLYKCCIYKIDTQLALADCDLQQQQQYHIFN